MSAFTLRRGAARRSAQAAGLTLAEIRSILAMRDSGQAPCDRVGALIGQHLDDIDRRMAELRNARTALLELARRAAATNPDTCAEGDICTILASTPAIPTTSTE